MALLPVTVSFFSKQQGPALPRSTVYALGIVFTLTVIGLVFKSSLDVMARGAAFNIFVGVLFLVLAFSLFGLFELRLPSFLIDRSQAQGSAGGLAGPFFMAVTLALTSFYFAYKANFAKHAKVARVTLPLWLYVSVTGVLIYFMLRGSTPAVP